VVGPDGTVRQVYGTVNPANHAKDVLADLHKQVSGSN